MARAPKLKVYCAPMGFHDALVAAPSQKAALKAWGGKSENIAAGQRAFSHRARMNGAAALGKWDEKLEKAA